MTSRLLAAAFGLLVSSAAYAVTEIHFWHAMDGALGDELNVLAQKFNASQPEFKVVPQLKGDYDTVLTELRNTALQGKDRPEIVQIVDVATQNAMMEKRFFRPVHQVMAEAGERLEAKAYAPAVAIFYSDPKGNLVSLPFNVATPVLYFNKDAFKDAGLDFNAPLKTWYNVQEALLAVQEKQTAKCGLTASYPSWTMLENVLAWHNEEFATRNNGYDGLNADLTFNTFLAMRHWSLMSSWVKAQIFSYSGRRNEAQQRFTSGECAMLVASSGAYANIARDARFRWGVMPMPYYDDFKGAPAHTSTGGASLFVVNGKTPAEYKGVAKFLAFLARPEVQAEWSAKTGYLPLSRAAVDLTRKNGYFDSNPGADIALDQVIGRTPIPASHARGVRLGNYQVIRAIIDEELELVWSNKKPPKAGLDDAVKRGNEQLRRFERMHKQ
jgi:sn-glycerol 3-phosphate transport system substrate-binding protein